MSQQALLPHSGWRRLNLILTTDGVPLRGEASFSAWNLPAFFPGWSSLLVLFRLVSSLSHGLGNEQQRERKAVWQAGSILWLAC
jgi:hypothetical protein